MPYTIISTHKPPQYHKKANIRSYKNFNADDFIEELTYQSSRLTSEWENHITIDKQEELEYKWNTWKDKFIEISNKHAPLRKIRLRPDGNSWINSDIVKCMNKRDNLKSIASTSKDPEDWRQYRKLRNKVNRMIQEAKKNHYQDIMQQKLRNIKFWKEITKLIPNKINVSSIPKRLSLDELNTYFSEVGSKTIKEVESNKTIRGMPWKGKDCIYDFEIEYIKEEDIERNLEKLKATTNSDILGMDCKLLKLGSSILSKNLCDIINLSIKTDIVPSDWKIARVTPLYKGKGDKEDPSNYRPISVVCHVGKIFEKLIAEQFISYLLKHNIINEDQSAYLKGRSTQTSLHRIIDDILESIDEGEITAACFIDITKCFDSIDHSFLLKKLEKHGIRKNIGWFRSYLSGRQQRVINNGELSESRYVNAGVPQGSVLGPFLFILFANDIGNFTGSGQINCYADDAVIYVSAKTIKEAKRQLQKCINAVEYWYTENKLKVNVSKTEVMIFGTPRKIANITNENFCIKFMGTKLRVVKHFKYLGIELDQGLSWNTHCEKMASKVGLKLHLMRRLNKILPRKTMIQIYKTYLMPILEYAVTVWGYTNARNINRIQRIINLSARIISNNYDFVNCRGKEILKELNLSTFEERRDLLLAVTMYKCHHGIAPNNLIDKLCLQNLYSERLSRHTDESTYHIPNTRTKAAEASFMITGPTIWNKIPVNVREAPCVNTFKKLYKKEILGLDVKLSHTEEN